MMTQEMQETIRRGPYQIKFPNKMNLDQNEEWCEVAIEDRS